MTIALILASAIAATASGSCSWAHPGANPYRSDPTAALADFAMPEETRRQLHALMSAHRYTDIATITRDDIVGQQRYGDLREMHSGHGQTCHGAVDRSAWDAGRKERGLVYCVGDTCILVPTICNNVSLVTRRPDQAAQDAEDDGPIDIAPAAGARPPADVPSTLTAGASPEDVLASPSSGDEATFAGSAGPGDTYAGSGGGVIGGPGPLGGPTPPSVPSLPTSLSPIATVPSVSNVPEPPVSSLMLAALIVVAALRRRSAERELSPWRRLRAAGHRPDPGSW